MRRFLSRRHLPPLTPRCQLHCFHASYAIERSARISSHDLRLITAIMSTAYRLPRRSAAELPPPHAHDFPAAFTDHFDTAIRHIGGSAASRFLGLFAIFSAFGQCSHCPAILITVCPSAAHMLSHHSHRPMRSAATISPATSSRAPALIILTATAKSAEIFGTRH